MEKKSWQQQSNAKRATKANRTDRNGVVHDSKTEMERWEYLKLLLRVGDIRHLQRQVTFKLCAPGMDLNPCCTRVLNDDGTCAEYTPDFIYEEKADRGRWVHVAEDVKGYADDPFSRFRIRVFEAFHGYQYGRVRIVRKVNRKWVTEK